jgi:hypothetical protein
MVGCLDESAPCRLCQLRRSRNLRDRGGSVRARHQIEEGKDERGRGTQAGQERRARGCREEVADHDGGYENDDWRESDQLRELAPRHGEQYERDPRHF